MTIIQTATTIVSLGTATVGTRQVASANAEEGEIAVSRARQVLFWGTLFLALIGSLGFWLLSGWISEVVLGSRERTGDIAWLALGVALTTVAGSQTAVLTGLRRVSDLALINACGSIVGAALGILVLWHWGRDGLVAMVLVGPLVALLAGYIYVARLGPPAGPRVPIREIMREWKVVVRLGLAFTISSLATASGNLVARAMIQRDLGSDALGQFHASWAIGATYLGFILGAMGTDYYPRLTGVISDRNAAIRLVNEQTEVALLLCAPILIALLGLAPWVVQLLYSSSFTESVSVLRWQLIGDIFKVMSWPLAFTLLATGAGGKFIVTETVAMIVFLSVLALLVSLMGVEAAGIAYLAMYAVYLPIVWALAGRQINFRWSKSVLMYSCVLVVTAVAVAILSRWSEIAGAISGMVTAGGMGVFAAIRLWAKEDLERV